MLALGLACLGLAAGARAQAAAGAGGPPLDGKALFHNRCGMCHEAFGMGTGLLARRVDPQVAELEKRTDLTADYVIQAARAGIGNMPAISRGEVSDAELAAIAAYLARRPAR
jgi:mono/diheme cytochrome c family protein